MNALFYAHSGLRYLVLLAGIVAVLYLGFALATRRGAERPGRVLSAVFIGLLDLQIVLGLLLVVLGMYYPAVIGHLVMMLLAAAVAHVSSVAARRSADARRALFLRFAGIVGALMLIVAGVHSIGRAVFGSQPPTLPL